MNKLFISVFIPTFRDHSEDALETRNNDIAEKYKVRFHRTIFDDRSQAS